MSSFFHLQKIECMINIDFYIIENTGCFGTNLILIGE